jgi:protoporphyrinogen oxidase
MKKTVVVIGAGPSGLVTAKTLLQQSSAELQYDPIVLEAEDDIGGTFKCVTIVICHPSPFELPCTPGIETTRMLA